EDELGAVEMEKLLILLDDGVLRLSEDAHQRRAVQIVQRDADGQAANELWDEAKFEQIVGNELRERAVAHLRRLLHRLEAHRLVAAQPLLDDLVQPLERAAA